MDSLFPLIPGWALVLLGLCLVGIVASVGVAVLMFLFKAGVAIHEARKPPHVDAGDYRIEQGREVRAEGRHRGGAEDAER